MLEIQDILTVNDLMDLFYIGKNTAYELLNSGQIKGFKIGRVWKIPRQSVEEFVMERCLDR